MNMNTGSTIEDLVAELRGRNGAAREKAREQLVKIGKPSVLHLVGLLADPNQHTRWEGCKALGSIKDPAAATALVDALNDDSDEIRWVAAEGLIALEERSLVPLLLLLQKKFESPFVREGAHHILYALERQDLLNDDAREVLSSLDHRKPKISVAMAAHRALRSIASTSGREHHPAHRHPNKHENPLQRERLDGA
jgi:HEAT repeat protein